MSPVSQPLATDAASDVEAGEVTRLLSQAGQGDGAAAEALIRLIHEELRRMAAHLMRRENSEHLLQTTALLNEAVIKLLGPGQLDALRNRSMLFHAAARAMRQVLIDYWRKLPRHDDGQPWRRIDWDPSNECQQFHDLELANLQEAMEALRTSNERGFRAVDLKFFGGLKVQEIADVLNVSKSTVEKSLAEARGFLLKRLVSR